MIPVETHDYTVFGDGYAEWDHYPHETTNEYMRGDYVRTEDADKAYDALAQENERLQQALAQAQERYNELLFAVEQKFHGESRHATALRYIQQAEASATIGQSSTPQEKA